MIEALCVAVLVLSITVAVLAGTVPWLWWRCLRLETETEDQCTELHKTMETLIALGMRVKSLEDKVKGIDTLDEAVTGIMEAAGLNKEQK